MHSGISKIWVCLLMLTFAGCNKSPQEKALNSALDLMKDTVSILKGVTDEASAKAAGVKLKALNEETLKSMKQFDNLAAPSAEEAKSLKDKYAKEMEDVQKQLEVERKRIRSDQKLSKALGAL